MLYDQEEGLVTLWANDVPAQPAALVKDSFHLNEVDGIFFGYHIPMGLQFLGIAAILLFDTVRLLPVHLVFIENGVEHGNQWFIQLRFCAAQFIDKFLPAVIRVQWI